MNKIILMGRLVLDPEVRVSSAGLNIVRFSLAVDRKFSKENTVDFINCTAFSKTAEFIEKYFKKGNKILLTGRLQQEQYTDKNGYKVNTYSVIADEVEFCESKANTTEMNNINFENLSSNDFDNSVLPF